MEELPINITDAVILLILVISAIFGFARGFVKEVLSITGWIGASFLALYLFPILKPYARQYIDNLLIADILTGAGIFILSLVILSFATHAISTKVKASALGALDRSLGIFYGIGRAVIIVGIAWLVLVQFIPPKDRPDWITEARMLPIAMASGEFVARLTPPDMQKNMSIAAESAADNAKAATETYEALPDAVHKEVQDKVKGALEKLDKGYDSKSRQQMENLTKGTQVKP